MVFTTATMIISSSDKKQFVEIDLAASATTYTSLS